RHLNRPTKTASLDWRSSPVVSQVLEPQNSLASTNSCYSHNNPLTKIVRCTNSIDNITKSRNHHFKPMYTHRRTYPQANSQSRWKRHVPYDYASQNPEK